MRAAGRYKKILKNVIDNIFSERDKYFVSPSSNFTRSGMITPQDIFTSLLLMLMEDSSLQGEMIEFFGSKNDIPTSSAFIQARAKIKPEAFEAFFVGFVSETADNRKKYLYKCYRLFAADGSDSHGLGNERSIKQMSNNEMQNNNSTKSALRLCAVLPY